MPVKNMGTLYFLDHMHGWSISSDADREATSEPFYVLSTRAGGTHWQAFPIQRPAMRSVTDLFPASIFFADAKHGWISWH
jgi:hypothetical protein